MPSSPVDVQEQKGRASKGMSAISKRQRPDSWLKSGEHIQNVCSIFFILGNAVKKTRHCNALQYFHVFCFFYCRCYIWHQKKGWRIMCSSVNSCNCFWFFLIIKVSGKSMKVWPRTIWRSFPQQLPCWSRRRDCYKRCVTCLRDGWRNASATSKWRFPLRLMKNNRSKITCFHFLLL